MKIEFLENIKELLDSQKRIHGLTKDREILQELDMLVLRSTQVLCNCNGIDGNIEHTILDFYMRCIMKNSDIIIKIDSKPFLVTCTNELQELLERIV